MKRVYGWASGRTLRHNQIFLPMVLRSARASHVQGAPLIKFWGNPAGKICELQTKATLEVKTRHFVTTIEG